VATSLSGQILRRHACQAAFQELSCKTTIRLGTYKRTTHPPSWLCHAVGTTAKGLKNTYLFLTYLHFLLDVMLPQFIFNNYIIFGLLGFWAVDTSALRLLGTLAFWPVGS
jgi:hypothetical protein